MGSEQNDGTSYQPSEPKLCVNNCGFFGSACTENLCSKCYRDSRIKAEQEATAIAAMEKSLPHNVFNQIEGNHSIVFSNPPIGTASSSELSPLTSMTFNSNNKPPSSEPETPNRCLTCKKKVGLMGFKCKCGLTFCGTHRYPDSHECSFDFKSADREKIEKDNPVVKADKVDRF